MKPFLNPPPVENSPSGEPSLLSDEVAQILRGQVQEQLQKHGQVQQAAQAAGMARTYLSQIRNGARLPRHRELYIRLFTQAFGWTQEEVDQLIAQAQLQELGFTNPELSVRLAEVQSRSKKLNSDQLEGLIDYLEGWLQRRRNREKE